MKPSNRLAKFQWHDGIVCSAFVRLSYRLSGAASWNCILVPGVISNVPAVCPNCACRPVLGELPGWKLFVFTATLRPFTEIDVSSILSGGACADLRETTEFFQTASCHYRGVS